MCDCSLMNQNGKCTKLGRPRACRPTTKDEYEEAVQMIDISRTCEHSSIFGNSLCYITKEQLVELVNGKAVYFNDGEYGWFLVLKKENEK